MREGGEIMRTKASTAALRQACERFSSPQRRVSRHPASGWQKPAMGKGLGNVGAFSPRHEMNVRSSLFRSHRVLWPGWNWLVVLQRFLCQFNRFFELWIMAAHDEIGPLRHDVIGIDAVLFDDPLPAIIHAPEPKPRRGDVAAVP